MGRVTAAVVPASMLLLAACTPAPPPAPAQFAPVAEQQPAPPAVEPPPERVAVSDEDLVVLEATIARSRPDANSEPVMRLAAGDVIKGGADLDGWIRVDDSPIEAWVLASQTQPRRLSDQEEADRIAYTMLQVREAKRASDAAERYAALDALAQLEVLSWKWSRKESGDYLYAEGEVKNITQERIEHVRPVVSYYTSGGDLVTSDTGLIDIRPLMPGQSSPFTIMTTYNPAISRAKLVFTDLGGAQLISRSKK